MPVPHCGSPSGYRTTRLPLSQGAVQLICRELGSPVGQSGLAGVKARCCLLRPRSHQSGLQPTPCPDAGQARLPAERARFAADQLDPALRYRQLAVRHRGGLPHVGLASGARRHGRLERRLPCRPAQRPGRGAVVRARPPHRPLHRDLPRRQARGRRPLRVERERPLRRHLCQRRAARLRRRPDRGRDPGRRVEQGLPQRGREGRGDRRAAHVLRPGRRRATRQARWRARSACIRASAPAARPGPMPRSGRRD